MTWTKAQMAQIAAEELHDGDCATLANGTPTLVAAHLPTGASAVLERDGGITAQRPPADVVFLDARQVAANGDVVCASHQGARPLGESRRVVVLTDHVAADGSSTIVAACTLPLSGTGVVDRIITERAVFDVDRPGLELRRVAPGTTVDEIAAATDAPFTVTIGALDLEAGLVGIGVVSYSPRGA